MLERGRVSVDELTRELGTSDVTIRNDLRSLDRSGRVRRVRGGAVRIGDSGDAAAFDQRVQREFPVKAAIAARAAELVRDGDTIWLDCSTTSYHLARRLGSRRNLVIITNGLRVAQALADNSTATVLMPGGTLHTTAQALVGGYFGNDFAPGSLRLGFFGPWAVSVDRGYLDVHAGEAEMKRAMLKVCDTSVAMFDATKESEFAFLPVVGLDDVTMSISDTRLTQRTAAALRSAGQEVTLVDPEP